MSETPFDRMPTPPAMKVGALSNFLVAGFMPWVLFIGGGVCAAVVYWGTLGRKAGEWKRYQL